MLRFVVSACAVAVFCLPLFADDVKNQDNKAAQQKIHAMKATITKVNPQAGTITVRMKDKDGKDVEKTFRLTEDVRYFDSTGRAAELDIFKSGNDVLVIEAEGKLKAMRKSTESKPQNEKERSTTPSKK